jgi:hypothetical protein
MSIALHPSSLAMSAPNEYDWRSFAVGFATPLILGAVYKLSSSLLAAAPRVDDKPHAQGLKARGRWR